MPILRATTALELWWPENVEAWLKDGSVPADCMFDIKTIRNTLSVYEVADQAQAKRVAAALALTRANGAAKKGQKQSLRDVSAMFFESSVLGEIGVRTAKQPGDTDDPEVNGWHIDLIELSGAQLVELAKHLLWKSKKETFFHIELLEELKTAGEQGRIQPTNIPERVAEQIIGLKKEPKTTEANDAAHHSDAVPIPASEPLNEAATGVIQSTHDVAVADDGSRRGLTTETFADRVKGCLRRYVGLWRRR